ncbi:MAG TPA: ATP-dependent zinc metalloprotease FtsH [Solirubrobacteraceae bacterium]|nr:ATP-dependent zinc metalloprotease FtsH [Solirubrobacteraceae bacterium]
MAEPENTQLPGSVPPPPARHRPGPAHPPLGRDKRGWQVSPAPDGRGTPPREQPTPPHRTRWFLWFVLGLLALNWVSLLLAQPSGQTRVTVPFSVFLGDLRGGEIKSISAKADAVEGTFKHKQRYPPHAKSATRTTLFATQVPAFWNSRQLTAELESHKVTISATSPTSSESLLEELLLGFGPTILFVGAFLWLMRRAARAGGGLGGLGAFGRSRARLVDSGNIPVTFADVAGIDEAKAELTEIVDFLRDPTRYARLGGRMPHGVLLSGAPGTGKTLLARAVAGEAHAAFFSISASEFIEAIVGVGASRVRDLFAQARQAAPAIVFIDELDAIGRSRQGSVSVTGANDEREQTLDQILTEMDGFEPTEAVVVLAATNRPDVLDSALLRAGRFDRRVAVQPPDRAGRRAILEVHTKGIPLAPSVDLDALASTTPGMVGADLANLANEAALLAARRNHDAVEMADFTDSLEKILLGAPRGIVLAPADRERTAYHESGHALVGMLTPGADPVRKVSIIPRGLALGVTLSTPDSDRVNYSREELQAKILVALGGRGAEEVVYGKITTGAESDIQQLIDEETRRIVESAHETVTALLKEHRDQLESLTRALLKAETLDAPEAYAAAGVPHAGVEAAPAPAPA